MRAAALTLAGLLGVLVLAGCGSTQPPQSFGVPSASAPQPRQLTPEEEQLFGPRIELPGGLLKKQIGKVAQWSAEGETDPSVWAMRIVVDKIEVDPDCGEYASPPERGHRLVISLRVETSDRYTDAFGVPQYYKWSTIGSDGVSEAPPSSTIDCRGAKAFPHELRPSAKYRGEVTVETANPAGQLVLEDMFVWDYPALV